MFMNAASKKDGHLINVIPTMLYVPNPLLNVVFFNDLFNPFPCKR
uniref:Zinc finger protein 729like [Aplysia californica] n=1 Tax=Lepeophtheirus salmonis TaxID=72036 RepID=A0A0K2U240_LEPSM